MRTLLKARVDEVGTFENDSEGRFFMDGWEFDCANGAGTVEVDSEGRVRVGGFTPNELAVIASEHHVDWKRHEGDVHATRRGWDLFY